MRANFTGKLWSSKCGTSRTTVNAWVNQEILLVARDKKWYQEICSRMHQVLTEQSVTHEESVRRGSHRGGSPQDVLGDERTCGTTLASAYVLCRLSAAWSQLQMKERSPSGSECWRVCRRWTLEIEFNKRLSLSIIRLADYNVTTSLIYKVVV